METHFSDVCIIFHSNVSSLFSSAVALDSSANSQHEKIKEKNCRLLNAQEEVCPFVSLTSIMHHQKSQKPAPEVLTRSAIHKQIHSRREYMNFPLSRNTRECASKVRRQKKARASGGRKVLFEIGGNRVRRCPTAKCISAGSPNPQNRYVAIPRSQKVAGIPPTARSIGEGWRMKASPRWLTVRLGKYITDFITPCVRLDRPTVRAVIPRGDDYIPASQSLTFTSRIYGHNGTEGLNHFCAICPYLLSTASHSRRKLQLRRRRFRMWRDSRRWGGGGLRKSLG